MQVQGLRARFYSMDWSPDKSLVAVGTWDGNIVLLDAATGKTVRVLDKIEVLPKRLCFFARWPSPCRAAARQPRRVRPGHGDGRGVAPLLGLGQG